MKISQAIFAVSATALLTAAYADDNTISSATEPARPGPVLAPYAWGISMSGTVGLNGLAVPLDLQTNELLRGTKSGGMGYLQWPTEKGFFYLEALGINFGQQDFQPLFNQSVDASLYMGEVGYGWNIATDTPYSAAGTTTVSPYLGVRSTKLKVVVDGPLLQQTVKQSWLYPIVGAILQGPVYGSISYVAKFDVGGFGVDGARYRSALGVLRYAFDQHWAVALGYRVSHFDSSDTGNGLTMDLTGKGPLAGLQYTF